MIPDPILTLGPFKVHMYGLMIAVGVLCAFVLLQVLSKKKRLDPKFVDFLFYTAVASTLVAFGSSVLFQAIYDYIKNPENGFKLGEGMTFIGGLIGALIAFFGSYAIFRKKLTGRMVDFLPILPCCITVAHAFGRVGCFFAGCCYGIHTGTGLDVHFPKLAESALPTQLYEAVFLFLLFGVLMLLLLKRNSIYTMSAYLIAYGVFRFAIEFVRDDERGSFIGALTPSQFWSVVMVLAGIALAVIMKKGRKPAWVSAGAPTEETGPDGTEEELQTESVAKLEIDPEPDTPDPDAENQTEKEQTDE